MPQCLPHKSPFSTAYNQAETSAHLVEHDLPVLRVPWGQENLLALLVDLIHSWG